MIHLPIPEMGNLIKYIRLKNTLVLTGVPERNIVLILPLFICLLKISDIIRHMAYVMSMIVKKNGRYYPREDIEHVCPTGWSIPSAEEANIVDYITFDGDTIYGISDRWLFPRTETYLSVEDSIIPTLSFLKIAYSPDSPSISHDLMICFICLRVSAKPNLPPPAWLMPRVLCNT